MIRKIIKSNLCRISYVQNIYQTCCYCMKNNKKDDYYLFFQKELNLPEREIKKIIKKYPSFSNDTYSSLSSNFSRLTNFGLSKKDILKKVQILGMHQLTIKNYVMLLEEGGFNKSKIDSRIIIRFRFMSEKSIESLKAENYIDENIDIQHHILSFINYPKELYPENCDDSLSWNQVQTNVFKLYIGWRINMDLENITYAQSIYHRLYNKSFRLMERSIDILLNELNFSEDKIRRHSYLIHSDPDNTKAIISNHKYLCGLDIKKLLNKHPKVLLTPWKTISEIKKHFEDFGIPESALYKAPEIYTLGSNSVYKRLCTLKETPELASFINNPQVARLIYYYKKVNSRLMYLKNKNCISLNLLVTNNSSFDRFNYNGNDKGKTNDIMIYLTGELGENKVKLRSLLERHPYWQYISLLTIRTTYEFLKKNNYTNKEICSCIQILLYPEIKIKEALVTIENMDVPYLRSASGSIKSDFILSLALYHLEKDYHFSGNGVWSANDENKRMSTSGCSKDTCEETEELDHNPLTKLV